MDSALTAKERILNLWSSVTRQDPSYFLDWLRDSDFFRAPCSTQFHLAVPGGLARHSLNVYEILENKVSEYGLDYPRESIIMCGLGHDLCKTNFYTIEKRNKKIDGKWQEVDVYVVKDQFPMGHGEKSVSILQDFFVLTEEEKLAIRWHMAAFDASIHFGYPNGFAYREACNKYPLVTLLFTADYEASNIIEKEE